MWPTIAFDRHWAVPHCDFVADDYENPLNGPPRKSPLELPDDHPPSKNDSYPRSLSVEAYQQKPRYTGTLVGVLVAIAVLFGGCAMLLSSLEWTKGRPLRGRRRPKRPRRTTSPASASEAAAQQWRSIAADEYESIATFSELALDLMAAGAPVDLVRRCHEAALEEERHTRICLDIARSLDGQDVPIPELPALRQSRRRPRWRTALLVRLAVESFLDGCIGEASSAWVLAQLRRTTELEEIRDSLHSLAREEMGHARLGRDIVRWCCAEGGPVVERAVARAEARIAEMQPPGLDGVHRDLRRFGVPDDLLRTEAFEWARDRAA